MGPVIERDNIATGAALGVLPTQAVGVVVVVRVLLEAVP